MDPQDSPDGDGNGTAGVGDVVNVDVDNAMDECNVDNVYNLLSLGDTIHLQDQ